MGRRKKNTNEMMYTDSTRAILEKTKKILNSDSEAVRKSVFATVVITDDLYGLSYFGKKYSEIVSKSIDHISKGSTNYINLVFPNGSAENEALFFSSPSRSASTTNRFYGTMLISLAEYDGDDLINGESYRRLLEFCDMNRENIRFIFHVSSKFKAKDKLVSTLQEHFPVMEVILDKPGVNESFDYVVSEMKHKEISFDKEAEAFLKEQLIPAVISKKSFSGYQSLNVLMDRMVVESVSNDKSNYVVLSSSMRTLCNNISNTRDSNEHVRIGFNM